MLLWMLLDALLELKAKSVSLVYRRDFEQMPARKEEVLHAQEEGVNFNVLTNPCEILGDELDNIVGVKCVKMELSAPDSSGRRRPVEIKNSQFIKNLTQLLWP